MLALAVAAVAALFFYASPERPSAEASPPPIAEAAEAIPEDKGLWLTVPKMSRVDGPVVTGPSTDEAALAQSALRVAGTGLPWQEEANVYIAGHRIGFEGEATTPLRAQPSRPRIRTC